MKSIDDTGWILASAEEWAAKYPDQFQIPPLSERQSLRKGAKVKLVFLVLQEDKTGPFVCAELMWVVVTHVDEMKYIGTLHSAPASVGALKTGALIEFGPEHVASILVPATDPRHPDFRQP